MELTKEQNDAIVTNDTNLRIIACAGSGKTTTIAHKIAYLLDEDNRLGILPQNIIAFTYTEKAAAELKNKVLERVKPQKGLADMYIGTIHGWCLKVLQENEFDFQKYSVLDEIKLQLFIDKNYDKIGMKDIYKLSNPNEYMRRFVDTKRFARIMEIIRESDLVNGELPVHIKEAKRKYEKTLHDKYYFDFSMIVDEALLHLKKDGSNLNKRVRDNVKYLIVDEYQDVNPKQEELIYSLYSISNAKLTVVGDDDQNIYQWRGSNNEYIIDFNKKYAPCKNVEISKNFRSSKGITELSKILINNNIHRINKEIVSAENQSFSKGIDILYNEYDNIREENESIASFIENLIGVEFYDKKNATPRGLAYSDFCVLLRTWNKAENIVDELTRRGIPYITAGVNHLFDTIEVRAALGIFQYLNEYITTKKELRDLWEKLPFVDFSKLDVDKAIDELEQLKPRLIQEKYNLGQKLADKEFAYNLQYILWTFLENAKIFEDSFVDGSDISRERAEIIFYNLGKFSQVIGDFEEINFSSSTASFHLFSFLSFINYAAQEYYPEGWISNPYKTLNAVQIMTIHQAKGLEFPVVLVPGLNRNYLPQKRKGGLSEWHYLDPCLIKNQSRYLGDIEDERRLLYVALTRAQKFLLLSRAPDASNRLYQRPSEFVMELNKSGMLVTRKDEDFSSLSKVDSMPLEKINGMTLDFTVLKDFFDCPYRFKLVSMFGFTYPLDQRMGLGKSFHNALMELHKRAQRGEAFTKQEIQNIAERQMYFPYIANSDRLKPVFEKRIRDNIEEYYKENKESFQDITFIEQEIQLNLGEGILVTGRVDLIKKKREDNLFETTIIEFKSKEESQSTKLTEDQLKLYALGHKELTGEIANYLMTYIIGDKDGQHTQVPYKLKPSDLNEIKNKINYCADKIRKLEFEKIHDKFICENCFQNPLCPNRIDHNVKSSLKK